MPEPEFTLCIGSGESGWSLQVDEGRDEGGGAFSGEEINEMQLMGQRYELFSGKRIAEIERGRDKMGVAVYKRERKS